MLGKNAAMQVRIVVAGKPALAYARQGVEEYLKRLQRSAACEWVVVKAGSPEETSARLLEKSQGCYRVAMDERGDLVTTRQLAGRMEKLELQGGVKAAAFLIGAADGHTEELRRVCDWVWALSPLTLQHEMALLVLMEQLYRVASIRSGSPYHRD
jgi:23S rRNA (pseudouridine1915-N3)-methyltransferase